MSNLTTTATRAITMGAAALALTGAAYAGTAIGHASPDSFVLEADYNGFTNSNGNRAQIRVGYSVCDQLNYDTEANVVYDLWMDSQLDYAGAQKFVRLAQVHLCN